MIKRLKEWSKNIKNNITALYLVLRHKDVKLYVKLFIGLVVGYALSPIDLIPDFIPLLGFLDDVIILPLGISLSIKMIPKDIFLQCKIKTEDIFKDNKQFYK